MTWVVTGGAGYIGAHVVQAFRDSGTDVVVIDDLSSGRAEFVPPDVPFVQVSILDTPTVAATLREHAAVGVVHLAAFKYAGVSVQRPLHTYMQNVVGTLSLLSAMEQAGVSSVTRSVSGVPYTAALEENTSEPTPACSIADNRLSVPTTFCMSVCRGRCTLTPAYLKAARCTTPSAACSRSVAATVGVSRIETWTRGTSGGTNSARPLERSSITTTAVPLSRNAWTTCAPM